MAAKLLEFYEKAGQAGGLQGKVKMAIITQLPSQKAAAAPDSPENIALFERALAEVKAA